VITNLPADLDTDLRSILDLFRHLQARPDFPPHLSLTVGALASPPPNASLPGWKPASRTISSSPPPDRRIGHEHSRHDHHRCLSV
jgi:hypothetical protein